MKLIIPNDKVTNDFFKTSKLSEFDRAVLNGLSTIYNADISEQETEEVQIDVNRLHKLLTNSQFTTTAMKEEILKSIHSMHKEKIIKGFKGDKTYTLTEIPFYTRSKKSKQIITIDASKLYINIKKTTYVIGLQHYIIRRMHQHTHLKSKLSRTLRLDDILDSSCQENKRRKDYIERILNPFDVTFTITKNKLTFE